MAFGIYIHWPYCTRICPYCDFNVYKARDETAAAWAGVLRQDLAWFAGKTADRTVTSIYFGGGTPSLMPPQLVAGLIEDIGAYWPLDESAEITLEANPTDAEQTRFADFRAAGINRLSLGVQSFDDRALKFLGRNHDAKEAQRALHLAAETFPDFTFDLIYARPGQPLTQWEQELQAGLATGTRHLSLYQLTIEPGTAFEKAVARGDWAMPDDAGQAAFFDLTQEICADAGLPAYEISNHAAPGARSRHNLIYWQAEDYLGIGPGAHGRLRQGSSRLALEATPRPVDYLRDAPEKKFEMSDLSAADQATEYLLMGLRLVEGVSVSRYTSIAGGPLNPDKLQELTAAGLTQQTGDRLALTADGRRLLNSVVLELVA